MEKKGMNALDFKIQSSNLPKIAKVPNSRSLSTKPIYH
jgi:hypothetical protein